MAEPMTILMVVQSPRIGPSLMKIASSMRGRRMSARTIFGSTELLWGSGALGCGLLMSQSGFGNVFPVFHELLKAEIGHGVFEHFVDDAKRNGADVGADEGCVGDVARVANGSDEYFGFDVGVVGVGGDDFFDEAHAVLAE